MVVIPAADCGHNPTRPRSPGYSKSASAVFSHAGESDALPSAKPRSGNLNACALHFQCGSSRNFRRALPADRQLGGCPSAFSLPGSLWMSVCLFGLSRRKANFEKIEFPGKNLLAPLWSHGILQMYRWILLPGDVIFQSPARSWPQSVVSAMQRWMAFFAFGCFVGTASISSAATTIFSENFARPGGPTAGNYRNVVTNNSELNPIDLNAGLSGGIVEHAGSRYSEPYPALRF